MLSAPPGETTRSSTRDGVKLPAVAVNVAPRWAGGYQCKGVIEQTVDAFSSMVQYLITELRCVGKSVAR